MRINTNFIRFSCLIFGTLLALTCAQAALFTDVPEKAIASRDISSAAYHQLMEGFPDGSFRPEAPLRRVESVMVVARLLHTALKGFMVLPAPSSAAPVDAHGHWSASAANFLAENGFADLTKAAMAAPGTPVTKGEFLTLLDRLLHAGERTTPEAAFNALREEALVPADWQGKLQSCILRQEVAQSVERFLGYLTKHAEAEGTITALETDDDGYRWATLHTAIGECRLYIPTRGVMISGGTQDDVRVGATIRTLSGAVGSTSARGKYYCVRELAMIQKAQMGAKL